MEGGGGKGREGTGKRGREGSGRDGGEREGIGESVMATKTSYLRVETRREAVGGERRGVGRIQRRIWAWGDEKRAREGEGR